VPIYEIDLKNVGPFDHAHFEFDPQINVFVGPNNCGKTAVLMALGDIAVYPFGFPEKLVRRESAQFIVSKGTSFAQRKTYKGTFPSTFPSSVGRVNRSNSKSRLSAGTLKELGYTCLIPALRWSTDYRAESPVSDKKREDAAYHRVLQQGPSGQIEEVLMEERPEGGAKEPTDLAKRRALIRTGPSLVRDRAVIQRIINLDYKAYREKNPAFRKIVEKVAAIASEITNGFPIEFVGVAEDANGLYPEFKTPDGRLPINVLSQGTQSVIQWLGILLIGYAEYYEFPKNLEEKPGIVFIDEIDAHMHPSWQRRILPALSRNFPNVQIFCSSHSPFVLAGLKAGQAHLLRRDDKGKLVVSRNERDIRGWSVDEILRNFMDVTNPTDLQTNKSIERLQELRTKRRLSHAEKKELQKLRDTINEDLLAGPVASEIERFRELMGKPSLPSPPLENARPHTRPRRIPAAR
jgi:hypothetical protein